MKITLFKYMLISLIWCTPFMVMAQDGDQEGEITEGEFKINKDLKITLPSAQRVFQKVPPRPVQETGNQNIDYNFDVAEPKVPDIETRLRVLKLKDEPIPYYSSNFIRLGFGNYISPLFDVSINSNADKTASYGVRYHHFSSLHGPVDKRNSGDGHNDFDLYGKYIGSKASLSGSLNYTRDKYHFYGYEPGIEVDRDTLKQVYNNLDISLNVKNTDVSSPLKYEAYGKIRKLKDNFDANEFVSKLGFDARYELDDHLSANLSMDFFYSQYKNPETINRTLFRMFPSFRLKSGLLTIDAGLKVMNHNDTLNEKSNTKLYPSGRVMYEMADEMTVYGIIDGDMEEVTLQKLSSENPWIMQGSPLNHQTKTLEIGGGVKGTLIQYLSYDAGVKAIAYKNFYTFLNNPYEQNKFDVLYDGGKTSLFQIYGSLNYAKSNDKGVSLSLKYNGYNTDRLQKAWHRPRIVSQLSGWYNLYDKVKLQSDLFVMSGIWTVDPLTQLPGYSGPVNYETLSTAVDMNLKLNYILSKKYEVFIHLNNIFNSEYSTYTNYPVRGLQALIGFTANF